MASIGEFVTRGASAESRPPRLSRRDLMQIVALKPCPQGQQPGTVFDAPDGAARVLIAVGAARAVAEDDAVTEPADPTATASPRRRSYRRRDLQADA